MRTIYRYPHKCMACSLHYVVYSWNENWNDRHAYCPECGKKGGFCLGVERMENDEIYNHVGGVVTNNPDQLELF